MIEILDLKTAKKSQMGTCTCCGKSVSADNDMVRVKFVNDNQGTSFCLCSECRKELSKQLQEDEVFEKNSESYEEVVNDLYKILLEKMNREYKEYLKRLELKSPKEIINSSYETVFKEDIIAAVEMQTLEPEHIKALLSVEYPLDYCYDEWLREDITYMDELRYCVKRYAKYILETQKELEEPVL